MIDFSGQTFENIKARMLMNMKADVDKREPSIANVSVAPTAIELSVIYEILTVIQNNSWILTAEGKYLDNKCLERGIVRKEATKAVKAIYFNINIPKDTRFSTIGLENALVYKTLDDSELVTTYAFDTIQFNIGSSSSIINYGYYYTNDTNKFYYNGVEITVNRVSTLPVPSSSTLGNYYLDTTSNTLYLGTERELYQAQAECETAGTIGNDYVGNVMPMINNQDLTYSFIGEIILAGSDIESDTSLRARYLYTLGSESFAGNISSYRAYTLSINGVGAVQVYPHYKGPGTVKLSILDSQYNLATQTLIDLVQNDICPPEEDDNTPSPLGFGKAPIGAKVDVGTGTERTINLSFSASLEQGATIESVKPKVVSVFNDYLLSVRQMWGNALITNKIAYSANVYIARLTSTILNKVPEILNITNMQLNGSSNDVYCIEKADYTTILPVDRQEIPIAGTVDITQA